MLVVGLFKFSSFYRDERSNQSGMQNSMLTSIFSVTAICACFCQKTPAIKLIIKVNSPFTIYQISFIKAKQFKIRNPLGAVSV
jgi:hypothetical protein